MIKSSAGKRRGVGRLAAICAVSTTLAGLAGALAASSDSNANVEAEEKAGIFKSYKPANGFRPATDFKAAPAGLYMLDPSHAYLEFQMKHYGGLSMPKLLFRFVEGEYQWDPSKPEATKIKARIQPTSIDANHRDFEMRVNAAEALNGGDSGESGKYRWITFESTSVKFTDRSPAGGHNGVMQGNLTIKGVTKPITVNLTYNGYLMNRLGHAAMGYSATAKFKRSDFGVTAIPSAGDDVNVTMELEFARAKNDKSTIDWTPFPSR